MAAVPGDGFHRGFRVPRVDVQGFTVHHRHARRIDQRRGTAGDDAAGGAPAERAHYQPAGGRRDRVTGGRGLDHQQWLAERDDRARIEPWRLDHAGHHLPVGVVLGVEPGSDAPELQPAGDSHIHLVGAAIPDTHCGSRVGELAYHFYTAADPGMHLCRGIPNGDRLPVLERGRAARGTQPGDGFLQYAGGVRSAVRDPLPGGELIPGAAGGWGAGDRGRAVRGDLET